MLTVLISVAYWGSLRNGFVWDDETFIVNNNYVHDLSRWKEYFTNAESISDEAVLSSMYRPVQTLSYAVDAALWGKNPAGYHLTSLLLHFACCAAILFAFGPAVGFRAALASAAIFAVHPALSEGVFSLAGRGNQLYTLWSLLALGFFVRIRSLFDRNHVLTVGGMLIALFSKEPAIALVALLPAVQATLEKPWRIGRSQSLFLHLPMALAAAAFLAVRSRVVGSLQVAPVWGGSLWSTIQMQAKVFALYLSLLIFPFHLRGRYDIAPPALFPDWWVIGALAMNVVLIGAGIVLYRRGGRGTFFGLAVAWFYLSLAPVSNIIPIPGSMMGERFIYFTFAGMLPLLAAVVEPSLSRKNLPVFASIAAVLFVAWIATDMARASVWRDNRSFFTATERQTPTSMAVQNMLAQQELADGNADAALSRVDRVLRERSNRPADAVTMDFHLLRGRAFLDLNRPAEAYAEIKAFADFHKKVSPKVAVLLAEAAAGSGSVDEALQLLKQESEKPTADDNVWNGLGNLYVMTKDFGAAADCYRRALGLNPGNTAAASNLQFALSNLRKP